jgi:hypothetical protein
MTGPSYSLAVLNASAALWATDRSSRGHSIELKRRHQHAQALCNMSKRILSGGGWCYRHDVFSKHAASRQRDWTGRTIHINTEGFRIVPLPHNQTYLLPAHHFPADARFLEALHHLLAASSRPGRPASVLDLGAGVGQYGHALLARDSTIRYAGYDGGGDVEALTNSFVGFADLTIERLTLPKACWVMSFAVAEHVPAAHEMPFVRNLHAHACRGIVLHWGPPEVPGRAHVNMRDAEYVQNLFSALGYRELKEWTFAFRYGMSRTHNVRAPLGPRFPWFTTGLKNTFVFERITPLSSREDGCQAKC